MLNKCHCHSATIAATLGYSPERAFVALMSAKVIETIGVRRYIDIKEKSEGRIKQRTKENVIV